MPTRPWSRGTNGSLRLVRVLCSCRATAGRLRIGLGTNELVSYPRCGCSAARQTAVAAIPSPRPQNPRPSVALAVTRTRAGSRPRAPARLAAISPVRWPRRGRSQSTATSRLTGAQPAAATSPATLRHRSMVEAPAQRGSAEGKWWPRSGRPAAPSTAAEAAWPATSASEWPSRPSSKGTTTPPRTSGRPGTSRWASTPCPTRSGGITAGPDSPGHPFGVPRTPPAPPGQEGLGDREIQSGDHREVLGIAGHELDPVAGQLDQGGVVAGLGPAGRGQPVGLLQGLADEQLRGLLGPELLAVDDADRALVVVDLADGVDHGHPRDHPGDPGPGRPEQLQQPVDRARADQGPGDVVDGHVPGAVGHGPEAGGHAGLAGRAAGDDRGHLGEALLGEQLGRGLHGVGVADHDHGGGAVVGLQGLHGEGQQGPAAQGGQGLGLAAAEPAAGTGRGHDHAHRHGGGGRRRRLLAGYDSSASSTSSLAVPSSQWQASTSSETRICRERWSMRFSPAERPFSRSRTVRSRTTSATWKMSPDWRRSMLPLKRRLQLPWVEDSPVRRMSKTPSTSSELQTSRMPTSWQLSRGTMRVRSPYVSLRTRYSLVSPPTSRSWRPSMTAAPCCG